MQIMNRVSLVTGGSGDIGFSIVNELISMKSKVIIIDKFEPKIRSKDVFFFKCDLKNSKEIYKTLKTIFKERFDISILINNAGLISNSLLVNYMEKDSLPNLNEWDDTLNINLKAPFLISSLVAQDMIKKRHEGIIINISSIAAKGNAGQSAYSSSKAGLESLTKVWAQELGPFGIRSVAIAPGYIDTNSTRKALKDEKLTEIKNKIPLKKLGKIENITKSIKFVIENDYFNGSVLSIDGGLSF